MDFGDSTFTSFEASTDWITFFEKFPQVDPTRQTEEEKKMWRVAKIHSHHGMQAFHSGTDTQDLVDNAPSLPFFLSLVVNYACAPFAEIAVAGEIEQKSVVRNKWKLNNFFLGDNKIEKKTDKKPVTYIIPCDVLYLTERWILDQIDLIKERNKPKTTTYDWQNRTPTLPYKSEYIDKSGVNNEKVGSKLHNPKGYRQVIDKLSELFILGQGTTATAKQLPSEVYDFIDFTLQPATKDKYLVAVKSYLITDWFLDHFDNTNLTEEEVIDCVRFFISGDIHKTKWLTKDFKVALDELETEVKLLRSVQGHALV